MPTKSIFGNGVPQSARDHFERGWVTAMDGDSLTAQTHFALAMKAAPGGVVYREAVVMANVCALDSPRFMKWKERWKHAREAAQYAVTFRDWQFVCSVLVSDVAAIKGAPREARQKLWRDAHRHSETSYGLASVFTEIGASSLRTHRLRYEKLLRTSLDTLNARLIEVLRDGDSLVTPYQAVRSAEGLLDGLATINAAKQEALQLCRTLLSAPDESWIDDNSAADVSRITDHRSNVEVRAEQIRTQRSPGCCLYGLFYALGVLPIRLLLSR